MNAKRDIYQEVTDRIVASLDVPKVERQVVIPRTGLMQRRNGVLYRVLTVNLNANEACSGGALHEVLALRVDTGAACYWFATDDEARKRGWIE